MLSGCSDDVIAANLAVREAVITGFKEQHGISAEALERNSSEVSAKLKKDHGKATPEVVAPELWNLLKSKGDGLKKNGTERI